MTRKHSSYPLYAVAGAMYLLCMVTSITGGTLINAKGIIPVTEKASLYLIFATAFELFNAFGVLLIAVCFYRLLIAYMPTLSLTYLIIRVIESAFCIGASFLPLLSSLPNEWMSPEQQLSFAAQLYALRSSFWDYVYPVLFITGGCLFYYMLYKSYLLPRYISLWGLCALIGVGVALFMPDLKMIPGMLIITNELYLGVYLLMVSYRMKNPPSKLRMR